MKILWFEITPPSAYRNSSYVLGAWQDSLEAIVRSNNEIDLTIAFIAPLGSKPKYENGVHYQPMEINYSPLEKVERLFTWKIDEILYKKLCKEILKTCKPDLIHIFGIEFPFGIIASEIDIPVVVHIQGAIIPYKNASYPPGYNSYTFIRELFPNMLEQLYVLVKEHKEKTRVKMENRLWKSVFYYMGRTDWDKSLTRILNPLAKYYHVDEALRGNFLDSKKKWKYSKNNKIKLLSVGIGSFWKGPDMLIKTAQILKNMNIEFEWDVAGAIRNDVKKIVEKKEKTTFQENNINILSFIEPQELIEKLVSCNLFIHNAYIDNSPNSICEAQILGVPVISTHVGGIDCLIENDVNGWLVPANDPWRLANMIIEQSKNEKKLNIISQNAILTASKRHNPNHINKQLMDCYHDLLTKKNI